MSYGDYVKQLTYLVFLKMADERSRAAYSQRGPVPAAYVWSLLVAKGGDALFAGKRGAETKPRPRRKCPVDQGSAE